MPIVHVPLRKYSKVTSVVSSSTLTVPAITPRIGVVIAGTTGTLMLLSISIFVFVLLPSIVPPVP